MGVLWLEKRQSCASGFAWYVCSNGPGFRGCCSMDPCTDGVCPAASQGTNLDAVSTTSPTQRIITTTPRETPTSTTPTSTTPTSTTPRITSTPTTTSPLTTTASPLTTITLSPTLTTADGGTVSPQETRVTTTVRGTDTIVIETTGGRTITISLNGDSTATVTSGPTTSTAVAGASETSESGNNMGPIIGGAVAGVVFLIILVAAFFFIRGRRREHNASPPYGAVSERSNGIAGFFAGIFPKKHASGSNVNSMASPDSPNPAKAGFFGFGFLKRRGGDTDAHYRDDTKVPDTPGSPPPLPGFTEMPAQSFAPLHPNVHLPYNMVELDSDAVTAPSELSAVSTPLYHTTRTSSSAWSPTPELPSEVSNSSTGAVLSPMRETHYSETSTAGGSPRPGQQSWGQPEQNSNLRGGGWPGMRANLNSLRRKPTRASSSLAPPPPPPPPQDPNTHVLSWMDYNADPGSSGHGGVIR